MSLLIVPATPVEGGPLTIRALGPFPQPAPEIYLQVEGRQVIVNLYGEDFVYPNLPPVASVQATIPAPAAGQYVLVERRCGGNPPPPSPLCATVSQQGFAVTDAFAVPADDLFAMATLAVAVAALAAQRIERALTALERLRV